MSCTFAVIIVKGKILSQQCMTMPEMTTGTLLPRCIAFKLRIFNNPLGIRLKNVIQFKGSLLPSLAFSSVSVREHQQGRNKKQE